MAGQPDETDLNIIRYLQQDGRMPYGQVAQQLDISEANVRRRVHRMVNQGVIRLCAVVDNFKLGYLCHVIIAIETGPNKAREIAKTVAELPEMRHVALATGEYDVIAVACFRSNKDLSDFLTDTLGRLDGVRRTQTIMMLDNIRNAYDWAPPSI